MKKILKALGMILLLLVLYYLVQGAVGFIFSFVRGVRLAFAVAAAGESADVMQMSEELMRQIADLLPWILLIAVCITIPLYYLIYMTRREELPIFVRLGNLHPVSVPVLVVLGLSVNVIIEAMLLILSEAESLKRFFENYNQLANFITGGDFIISLTAVGVVGPVFEELLFRGLVFGELRKIATVRLAIVIQALIFGIYHINPVQGTYAFLIGLLLGYIYYRSSSIVAPMIVHVTINTSSVVAGRLLSGVPYDGWGTPVAIAGLLLFILTGAFILLHRSFRHVMDDGLYRASRAPKLQPGQENGG